MDQKIKATAAVIAGNAIFGFSFLFSKLALDITEPSVLIAMRFTVAFLLLNVIVFIGKRIKGKDGGPLIRFSLRGKPKKDILLLMLFQPIIYFVAENYGIAATSSAFAGVIIAMIPLAGILFDVVLMHRRVEKLQVICALGSVVGVFLTTIGSSDMRASLQGLLFLLIAVVAGALFYVFSQRSGAHYSALERTYVMFGGGAAAYLMFAGVRCAIVGGQIVTQAVASPVFWMAILYLSCVSSVLAFLLLNYGSNYVSVSHATLFANITTIISMLAGVLILHEAFSWVQIVGAAVIVASVYIAQVVKR